MLASKLSSLGFKPPSEPYLTDALIVTIFFICVSAVVLLLTPLFSKRDKRNAVLIVGVSGEGDAPAVGKTSLFKALQSSQPPKHGTVPSMQINDAIFAPASSSVPLRWIDFPGHPRLRHTLPPYLTQAKCIVFVIDAQRFMAQARKDAELLYYILTDPNVAKQATPVLIFCNKSDVPNPAKTVAVQIRLEAELERAKAASTATLRSASVTDAVDPSEMDEKRAFLGFENEPFSFEHASSPVSFASGSARTGDVEAVINFVRSNFL